MNTNTAVMDVDTKNKRKIINADVKYFIRAQEITPSHWGLIKTSYRKLYKKMRDEIQRYGLDRLTFGFSEDLKPVCSIVAF